MTLPWSALEAEPPLTSFLSEAAGAEHQGLIQGGSQSIQALAAMSAALVGGVFYASTGLASLFWAGAAVILLLVFVLRKAIVLLQHKPTG